MPEVILAWLVEALGLGSVGLWCSGSHWWLLGNPVLLRLSDVRHLVVELLKLFELIHLHLR